MKDFAPLIDRMVEQFRSELIRELNAAQASASDSFLLPPRRVLTRKQVAAKIGRHTRTLDRLRASEGFPPPLGVGGWYDDVIDKWIATYKGTRPGPLLR